jgi:hypothetical protein
MLQSKSAMSFVAVFRGRASEHAIKHVPAGWQLKGREGIENLIMLILFRVSWCERTLDLVLLGVSSVTVKHTLSMCRVPLQRPGFLFPLSPRLYIYTHAQSLM